MCCVSLQLLGNLKAILFTRWLISEAGNRKKQLPIGKDAMDSERGTEALLWTGGNNAGLNYAVGHSSI